MASLPWETYLTAIRADVDRLLDVATDLSAEVPPCPGWTTGDLLTHLAVVHLGKAETVRTGANPDPWPPADLDTSDPRALLNRAADGILAELRAHDPAEPTFTWHPADRTVGFWYRRMAHETTVHRVDGELAAGARPGTIADELALDGIDEVLRVMFGRRGSGSEDHPVDGTVRVTSQGRTWETEAGGNSSVVTEIGPNAPPSHEGDVSAEIAGSPQAVYLWLWGRGPADRLAVSGDEDMAGEFRERVAEHL